MKKDIIENRLREQLKYVLESSDFYREKFGNITTDNAYDNFESLPFTTKKEVLEDQINTPPFGKNCCVSNEKIRRVHKTSGTTNKPVLIALTNSDVKVIHDIGSECFKESGLLPSDTVVHCLNYNMWAGGLTDHISLESTGATVVPFGVGHTANLIEVIRDLKATAIHCTPSYLSKIEDVLDNEFGMKPRDLNLRLGLLGAESGLQNPEFRKKIEETWGFKAINANYGMSEVLSMVASECTLQKGLHFRAFDVLYVELIDEDNKVIEIKPGAVGEMVFTNLCKEAQPLVRYKSGDVIKVIANRCECGYEGMLFEIVGRSDDMIVVKGLNVFVSAIEKVIQSHFSEITMEYRVLVSKNDPIEDIIVQVEGLKTDSKVRDELKERLVIELKDKINVKCEVQVLFPQTLPRTDGKTKRLQRIL